MSLFFRRKDKQIPKTPITQDKALQNWLDSVGSLLNKYLFGGGNDRLITAQELIDSGLAGVGNGGFLTNPPKNITKPPKVSELTANGAFASIFVQWTNPSFSNYGYTELWRSNVDDIGQAVLIASTAVESYVDNVGSAATKYYWARAVSDSGVKGEFNSAQGTKGQTSYDPDYVKQLLTASKWQANTVYAPYQVVQPTTENGYQYMCIDGGQSGSVEPTWPTTVNDTVSDGGIEWRCLTATERLPLVVGQLPNGDPAVFIDTAFIKQASITSAMIGNLVADKIETGNLIADLQVKNKLWYGFNLPNGDFLNDDNVIVQGKTGFYLGVSGTNGLPILHLNTGIANGSKQILFDGIDLKIENVNLVSSADGQFDDLRGDSVDFERARFDFLDFGEMVVSSDKVREIPVIDIGDPLYINYLCYPQGVRKTETKTSPSLYLTNSYAFFQTPLYQSIVPYDWPDANTRYRSKTKAIGFSIKVTGFGAGFSYSVGSQMVVYIFDDSQSLPALAYNNNSPTHGIPANYLAKIDLTSLVFVDYFEPSTVTSTQKSGGVESPVFNVDVLQNYNGGENEYTSALITCDNDQEFLNYTGSRRLRVAVVFRRFTDKVSISTITVDFQLHSASSIDVPDNDLPITLTFTPRTNPFESGEQRE
jgi:hypothetical protein